MAWTLLTEVYGLDSSRLIVTIFGGEPSLGLPADKEAFDIWRSIGVPADRIVALGMKDNFWEMGETGPCGICTEIHYQIKPINNISGNSSRADIEKALMNSSIEIWNLVFIQYFRNSDGVLNRLDKNFVDTGMGLERILSILQGVDNNYQTDLFTPFFDQIHRITKWPEYSGLLQYNNDISYRILADHSRMAAISIADGILPDDRGAGYLLRRIIRRAVDSVRKLSKNISPLPEGIDELKLLQELSQITVNTLGEAFPELQDNYENILKVLEDEVKYYNSAFKRNEKIARISKNLDLFLCENPTDNIKNILLKCEQIDEKLNSIEKNLTESCPKIEQKQLDSVEIDVKNC